MKRTLWIFSTREAYLLLATCMFMGLFVGFLLQALLGILEVGAAWENLAVLLSELVILLPAYLVLRQRNITPLQVMPLKDTIWTSYLMTILLVLGVLGLISVFEVLIIPFFPVPDFLKQMDAEMASASLGEISILMLAAIVVAPLVEEVIFRGFLQQSLYYRFGSTLPAIVIPSLVFALFHVAYLFYFPALVELLVLAFLLAWLMLKTANILVPMLAHALFNLSSFISLFSPEMEATRSLADLGWTWIILSTVLTLLGVGYFLLLPRAEIEEVYLIPDLGSPGGQDA